MAEVSNDHRAIFDARPEHIEGAAMIFKLPPQFGHPLAGLSSRHRLSRGEEFFFLPLLINSSTFDRLSHAPLFSIGRCRTLVRTSHPSGSRPWENSQKENFIPPLASYLPQKTVGTTPCPRLFGSQILWLIPCGRPTQMWLTAWAYHLIKSLPSCLVFWDGTAANQCCVVVNQPELRAHCPVPTVSVLCQANALETSNAIWSFIM